MRARTDDALYYGALAATLALGVATLWSVDYLPTNDGPQHIFLAHAENLYDDPRTIYAQQFVPQVQFASRGFALWWSPLEPALGWRDATRVVLSLFYTWSFVGFALLVSALGRERRWLALLGAGVALSWPLYMGLLPYYAGLGLGLLVLGYVARRPSFDSRAALVAGAGLTLQFFHHAFSAVPTALLMAILVGVRAEPSARRGELGRLALALAPLSLGLLSLVWIRPPAPAGGPDLHWEPLLRRPLILLRVLWSGGAPTRWLGGALLAGGLVASVARFRRSRGLERAFIACAWASGLLLATLPIVIPGWQFFNVRFAPFLVAFALPLLPIERLRRPALGAALSVACATCFVASAVTFHRSLRAACADDLAGLPLAVTRTGFRFPVVLDPFCGLPRDATQAAVPFLGPARQLAGLYAAAQGGTIPNAFAGMPAIHPFTPRREGAPRVPIPDDALLRLGEDPAHLPTLDARRRALEAIAIGAQSYDDVLVFGGTDADMAIFDELGFRPRLRQRGFAMLELAGCQTELVVEDHPGAASIVVAGGLGDRPEITWERPVKPGPVTPQGAIVRPVPQRLCGPGWISARYLVGGAAVACRGTADGRVPYVARPGEITRVRCEAPGR